MSFDVVFGQLLGTTALVCLWPLFLSFLPYRALRKLFPPIVTGVSADIFHRECRAAGTQQNCVWVCRLTGYGQWKQLASQGTHVCVRAKVTSCSWV